MPSCRTKLKKLEEWANITYEKIIWKEVGCLGCGHLHGGDCSRWCDEWVRTLSSTKLRCDKWVHRDCYMCDRIFKRDKSLGTGMNFERCNGCEKV